MPSLDEFEKTCFVIMPFGNKPVDGKTVDFDAIYRGIFEPAISAARTTEGESLKPLRTDQEKFSSSINQDMFDYILYSRMALADVSGLNANAMYELGARHALQESGTVILRQKGQGIPYDIRTIKVFEYEFGSDNSKDRAKADISDILTNTLARNRLDSPIRQALQVRRAKQASPAGGAASGAGMPQHTASDLPRAPDLDALMRDAEQALLDGEPVVARTIYQILLRLDPGSLLARMKLAMVLSDHLGDVPGAHEEFATLVRMHPEYGEAWREKAVLESRILRNFKKDAGDRAVWAEHAHRSFARATGLNSADADAWSAWGGLLRRIDREQEALAKYKKGAEVSDGHPYPLLNAMKLEAKLAGSAELSFDEELMRKAHDVRRAQAYGDPVQDAPWSFFDLAEIRLFTGDRDGFLAALKDGLASVTQKSKKWQVESFRDGLKTTLVENGISLPGLEEGMEMVERRLVVLEGG